MRIRELSNESNDAIVKHYQNTYFQIIENTNSKRRVVMLEDYIASVDDMLDRFGWGGRHHNQLLTLRAQAIMMHKSSKEALDREFKMKAIQWAAHGAMALALLYATQPLVWHVWHILTSSTPK